MPLPSQTLAAIQTAGAAIYAADAELKKSVQDYADQVKAAMLGNPFDLGNDTLFEDWKTVARLSQAITQIEAEFKKIYSAASDLSAGSRSGIAVMPTLTGPALSASADLEVVKDIDATDAVIKRAPKKLKRVATRKQANRPLRGNTLTLLEHLVQVLNPTDFVKINQAAVAKDIGLAKGSIGASIAKLVQTGHLVTGPTGAFKLSVPKAH